MRRVFTEQVNCLYPDVLLGLPKLTSVPKTSTEVVPIRMTIQLTTRKGM